MVVPSSDQIPEAEREWSAASGRVLPLAVSPYRRRTDFDEITDAIVDWVPDLVVLDCFGFDEGMKAVIRDRVGVPVILPRTVIGRTVAELL